MRLTIISKCEFMGKTYRRGDKVVLRNAGSLVDNGQALEGYVSLPEKTAVSIDYATMSKAELKARAKLAGVTGYSRMSKEKLIEALT